MKKYKFSLRFSYFMIHVKSKVEIRNHFVTRDMKEINPNAVRNV